MNETTVNPKVVAGGVSAAVATLVVFIAAMLGLPIPPGVEGAIAVLAATIGGYLKRDNRV